MGREFGFLEREDFNEGWFGEFLENVGMVHVISFFPWYLRTVRMLPGWLRGWLVQVAVRMVGFHHVGFYHGHGILSGDADSWKTGGRARSCENEQC